MEPGGNVSGAGEIRFLGGHRAALANGEGDIARFRAQGKEGTEEQINRDGGVCGFHLGNPGLAGM